MPNAQERSAKGNQALGWLFLALLAAGWLHLIPDRLFAASIGMGMCLYGYTLVFGSAVAEISRYWGWPTEGRTYERAKTVGKMAGVFFIVLGAIVAIVLLLGASGLPERASF